MELRKLKRLSTATDLLMYMGIASCSAALALAPSLAAGYNDGVDLIRCTISTECSLNAIFNLPLQIQFDL